MRRCDETDVVEATQRAAEEEEESCRPEACLVCRIAACAAARTIVSTRS